MNKECRRRLRTARTLNGFWNILNEYYDLDLNIPMMYRGIILASLSGLIKKLGVKERNHITIEDESD